MDYSKIKATWWSGTCYHKEQLDAIISSSDIRSYAYILHDKDKQTNSDTLKKPHYHFLVQFGQQQRGAWFKAFATDDMGIVFCERCTIPKAAYDYLIHDTPTCKKQGKYLYDQSERTSTIEDFGTDENEDENLELYNDLQDLLATKITWHDLIKKKPKRIHMIANIKVAFDLLFFEAYGMRYYDTGRQPIRQPQNKTYQKQTAIPKPTPTELIPIDDDNMPF